MSDANGGVRDVHMLTTRTRGSIGVNPEIFFIDLDVRDILEKRSDFEGRKSCLTFPLSVERRNTDEPMYAMFRTEPPISMATIHQERCGRDTRLVASRDFAELDVETALFSPAKEHPEKVAELKTKLAAVQG
jgi:hypothetical protein